VRPALVTRMSVAKCAIGVAAFRPAARGFFRRQSATRAWGSMVNQICIQKRALVGLLLSA
jgi:hypothetical protein